jgi:hypothetical protein
VWTLLLAVGLLVAALGRRQDRAVPFLAPAAKSQDPRAVVLRFPARAKPGAKRAKRRGNARSQG